MPVLTVLNGAHRTDAYLPKDNDDTKPPGSNLGYVHAETEKYLTKWMTRYKLALV